MKVKLKSKHINQGRPADIWFCPIALALKEKTHKAVMVTSCWDISINGRDYKVATEREKDLVEDFIQCFDETKTLKDRKKLKTFSFTLVPLEA